MSDKSPKQIDSYIVNIVEESKRFQKKNNITEKERVELIKKYQAGDESVLDELMMCYYPLLAKLTHQFRNCGLTANDIFMECVVATIKSLQKYDDSQGATSGTFIFEAVKNALFVNRRRMLKHTTHELSLFIKVTDDEDLELIDVYEDPTQIVNPEEIYIRDEVHPIVNEFIDRLSEKNQDIFCSTYGFRNYPQLTESELGEKYGVTRGAINNKNRAWRKKLARKWDREKE